MKEYVGEEEWEEFQPPHSLSPDISGKLWENINKNTASPVLHYPHFGWMAAAASVLLFVGLSWQFLFKKQETTIVPPSTVAITQRIVNTTPQKKALTLSDGSTVELLPSSTLSYPESFNALRREVALNGEATFDIARDVAKPFSVYCNSLLITVLGTRFTVNSYDSNTVTKVILHEGRVMVKISDPSSKDKNEYYLTPGDIFIYKKALSARILHLEKDKEDGYVFNNYPLDVVFDQLQIIYNTKIIYNKAELGNRTFIGKIDKKDPLCHILQSIVLLNNFDLQKQGDSFIISGRPTASPN
ncbi:MAG TPA: FecR domain-containing protein [Puia sp.]|nr:FecR domain-containing protein [Puia sp.]